MKCKIHQWQVVLAAVAVAGCLGCSRETGNTPTPPANQSAASNGTADSGDNSGDNSGGNSAIAKGRSAEEPVAPPTIPKVILPDSLAATCLVKVGDPMPQGQLMGLQGNGQSLQACFGEKLTVVLFWTSRNMYAQDALEHVSKHVVRPFSAKGVRAVCINEGDTPEVVLKAIDLLDPKFPLPSLLDPGGQYFAQVANDRPLRPYLLDAQGKILWFDIEYSESTRRDLIQAIRVALGEI